MGEREEGGDRGNEHFVGYTCHSHSEKWKRGVCSIPFYLIPLGRLSESGAVVLLPALPQLWGYRYIHYHTQLLMRLLGIFTRIPILVQQALLPLSHLLCPRWDICWVLFSFMSSCSCFLSALNSLLKKTRNIELQDLNLNFRKASLWLSPSFNPPDNVFLQYMAQDNFSSPIWPREIKMGMHPVSCLTLCAKHSLVHTQIILHLHAMVSMHRLSASLPSSFHFLLCIPS